VPAKIKKYKDFLMSLCRVADTDSTVFRRPVLLWPPTA
jgi:hypothetical protein